MTFRTATVAALLGLSSYLMATPGAQAPPPSEFCRVEGRITSGATPLPGVAVGVRTDDASRIVTSTELDGRFVMNVRPGATYRLFTNFTGFAEVERTVTVGTAPCGTTVDFQLTLARADRTAAPNAAANAPRRHRARRRWPADASPSGAAGAAPPAGRGGQRFQTLNVQGGGRDGGEPETAPALDTTEVSSLLPPGFSLESAQSDAIAMNGTGSATNVNRGLMNDRLRAIDAGELDPATGQFAAGFGPPGRDRADQVVPAEGPADSAGAAVDRAAGPAVDLAGRVDSCSAAAARAHRIHIRDPRPIRSAALRSTARRTNSGRMFRSPNRSLRRTLTAARSAAH